MQDRIEEGIPTDDLSDETIEAFFQEDSPARALLARKIAQHTEDHSRMEASESEALGSLADVVRYVQEKIEPSYRGKIDPSLEHLHSGQYIVSHHGSDALCWKVEEDATHA